MTDFTQSKKVSTRAEILSPTGNAVAWKSMKTPTTLDEVSEPRVVFTGAKGAILAFAVTALMLAAIYLVVGGKEEAQKKGQAAGYLHTMPSLSSLRPPPDPPAPAPAGKPMPNVTLPAQPPAQAEPEIPAAPSPKQNKKPGTPTKEGRPWVINVASVQSKANAQHVLDRLKKGGYNAYIDEAQQDGTLWHRVRVGFFPSREEARRTAQEISQSYGLQSPWLAEQPQE